MSGYPPPAGEPGGVGGDGNHPHNIATAIAEVSERATGLVHEEIELLKAELEEKFGRLARGAIVATAAGVFLLMAMIFALAGCAWLLYWALPVETFAYFWGFFAMAVILVALGVIAGLVAARVVKRAVPPVPSMAIEEARKIREAVSSPDVVHITQGAAAPAEETAGGPEGAPA